MLKRREHLDPEKSEPQRLERALKLNSDLAAAYFLKEELSNIWEQDDYDTAEGMLLDWIKYAESLQIKEISDFAKMLRRHAIGILAYYHCGHGKKHWRLIWKEFVLETVYHQYQLMRLPISGRKGCDAADSGLWYIMARSTNRMPIFVDISFKRFFRKCRSKSLAFKKTL